MQDANCDHAGRRGGPVSFALEEGSRKPPAGCVWLAASPTYRQSTDAQAPATHRDPERSRGWTGHPGAAGVDIAVVVSDTFGRAWRRGLTDVAIGVAGLAGVVDLRGSTDSRGRELHATEVAVADEVAAAAELGMGKAAGIPAAIVRGLDPSWFRESAVEELIPDLRDGQPLGAHFGGHHRDPRGKSMPWDARYRIMATRPVPSWSPERW